MIQQKIYLSIFVMLLSGCATAVPEPKIIQRAGGDVLITTDDHKVAYFKKYGSLERVCAARSSDAVATDESGITLGFSGLGKTESVGEMSGRGELGLGGRSPVVLITREFLFRACELSNNINADAQTTIDIYKTFLKSLETITQHHFNKGTTSMSSSLPPYTLPSVSTKDKTDENEDEDEDEDDSN